MVYIPMRGRYCDIRMDLNCFDNESVYPIDTITIKMNGDSAYAIKCTKCSSEYTMYKSMFIQRYFGYDLLSGGHVNPTHGTKLIVASMDRKAKEDYNNTEKYIAEQMCKFLNCSLEEYREQKRNGKKKIN